METRETLFNKLREISEKHKHFCPLFFSHVHVGTINEKTYCCVARAPDTPEQDPGETYVKETVSEWWHSDKFNSDRKNILSNFKPDAKIKECEVCWMQEENNQISYRQQNIKELFDSDVKRKDHHLTQIIENVQATLDNKPLPHNPQTFDTKFGNLCNLKCPTCSPYNSSQHLKEVESNKSLYNKLDEKTRKNYLVKEYFGTDKLFDWVNDENWWKDFFEISDNLIRIKSTGGEPILNSTFNNFLQKLIEQDKAKNILVEMISNGQTFSKKLKEEVFEKFKETRIILSVDAMGKQYEYIRFPGKWNVLDKNVKMFTFKNPDSIKAKITRVKIRFHPTLSILNLLSLGEVMLWTLRLNKDQNSPNLTEDHVYNDRFIIGDVGFVFFPEHLSISHLLTDSMKKEAIKYWSKIIVKIKLEKNPNVFQQTNYINMCKDIIKRIENSNLKENYRDQFVKYISTIDSIRGNSFKESCPKEYKLVKEHFK